MKFLRIAVLLTILTCPMLRISADSIEVSGMVSGTWDVDTVNVTGNLQIREVESLNIMPGALIRFLGEYYFEVQGSLRAVGSEGQPVRFTMADTTGFHNDTIPDGGWKQIRIESISQNVDSTIFRFCHFEFGKAVAADSVHGYGGALCIRNTHKVEVKNCTFENNYAFYNGGAVYLENASIRMIQNSFLNNCCGQTFAYYGYGGGLCTDWGEPQIQRNYFWGNSSTGIAGGLCVRFSDCPVFHNVFDNNYSALGGGFGILHIDTCKYVISNNLVINNGALYFGAGISNNDCSPTYVNNTIVNNHCDGGGGGFYCKDSVVPVLHNNILYGNTQYGGEANQVYLWDLLAQPDFYYNNVQGGPAGFAGTGGAAFSGAYQFNIDEDPQLEPETFVPVDQSPCINAGNPDTSALFIPLLDLQYQNRIVGSRIDMGACENQNPVLTGELNKPEAGLFPPTPNPSSGKVELSFAMSEQKVVSLIIMDAGGRIVQRIFDGTLPAGTHRFDWQPDTTNSSPGLYFCVLKSDGQTFIEKIVIGK